jgi:hypothetical protein
MVIEKAPIMPIKGHELEPVCRNCRYWDRNKKGLCTKKSSFYLNYEKMKMENNELYTLPNSVCEEFKAWHIHIDRHIEQEFKKESRKTYIMLILSFMPVLLSFLWAYRFI